MTYCQWVKKNNLPLLPEVCKIFQRVPPYEIEYRDNLGFKRYQRIDGMNLNKLTKINSLNFWIAIGLELQKAHKSFNNQNDRIEVLEKKLNIVAGVLKIENIGIKIEENIRESEGDKNINIIDIDIDGEDEDVENKPVDTRDSPETRNKIGSRDGQLYSDQSEEIKKILERISAIDFKVAFHDTEFDRAQKRINAVEEGVRQEVMKSSNQITIVQSAITAIKTDMANKAREIEEKIAAIERGINAEIKKAMDDMKNDINKVKDDAKKEMIELLTGETEKIKSATMSMMNDGINKRIQELNAKSSEGKISINEQIEYIKSEAKREIDDIIAKKIANEAEKIAKNYEEKFTKKTKEIEEHYNKKNELDKFAIEARKSAEYIFGNTAERIEKIENELADWLLKQKVVTDKYDALSKDYGATKEEMKEEIVTILNRSENMKIDISNIYKNFTSLIPSLKNDVLDIKTGRTDLYERINNIKDEIEKGKSNNAADVYMIRGELKKIDVTLKNHTGIIEKNVNAIADSTRDRDNRNYDKEQIAKLYSIVDAIQSEMKNYGDINDIKNNCCAPFLIGANNESASCSEAQFGKEDEATLHYMANFLQIFGEVY